MHRVNQQCFEHFPVNFLVNPRKAVVPAWQVTPASTPVQWLELSTVRIPVPSEVESSHYSRNCKGQDVGRRPLFLPCSSTWHAPWPGATFLPAHASREHITMIKQTTRHEIPVEFLVRLVTPCFKLDRYRGTKGRASTTHIDNAAMQLSCWRAVDIHSCRAQRNQYTTVNCSCNCSSSWVLSAQDNTEYSHKKFVSG